MALSTRPNLEYNPADIVNDDIKCQVEIGEAVADDVATADRLLDHMIQIKEWKDRVDAFNYLIDNAAKIAGNPTFKTNDIGILNAMRGLGFEGDEVDFNMFKECISIVIEGFKQMSLTSITGVMNGD